MGRHDALPDRGHPRPELVPVDQRRLGMDRASIGPALSVLALALVLVLGLSVLNALVPADDELRPGDVVVLAGGVALVPATGWRLADGLRAADVGAGSAPATATLTDGAATLTLQSAPWPATATDLLAQVTATASALEGPRFLDGTRALPTRGGDAVVARYRGVQGDGLLAGVVLSSDGARIGVSAEVTGPTEATEDALAMITSLAPVAS